MGRENGHGWSNIIWVCWGGGIERMGDIHFKPLNVLVCVFVFASAQNAKSNTQCLPPPPYPILFINFATPAFYRLVNAKII